MKKDSNRVDRMDDQKGKKKQEEWRGKENIPGTQVLPDRYTHAPSLPLSLQETRVHREAEGSLRFQEEGKEATHFSRQVTTQPRDCDNQADTGSCSSGSGSSSRSNGRWRKGGVF